jgi:hypothetical protein
MRDSLSLADMLDALKAMQQAEQTATYVYKRWDHESTPWGSALLLE